LLEAAVQASLQRTGSALVLDCHSFPEKTLPYEMDQSANRPDICLGADEYHTSDGLLDLAHDVLVSSGYSVAVNTPFSGCLLPMSSYQKTKRVQELMIEVNRGSRVEPLQSQRKGSTHTAA
jgi:N-formylglutamate amidohydrolase